jgi:hypothetical protein
MGIIEDAMYAKVLNPANKEGLAITVFRGGKAFGVDIDPKFEKDLREMPFSYFCEVYLKPAFTQLQQMMEEQNGKTS